jgi:hypothetical protein
VFTTSNFWFNDPSTYQPSDALSTPVPIGASSVQTEVNFVVLTASSMPKLTRANGEALSRSPDQAGSTADPAAAMPMTVETVFTVECPWKGCGHPVSATRVDMERTARGHLKAHHGDEDDLKRKRGDVKNCRCVGCNLVTDTVRTHVARTNFVRACKMRRVA